jgi:hypothetical protein
MGAGVRGSIYLNDGEGKREAFVVSTIWDDGLKYISLAPGTRREFIQSGRDLDEATLRRAAFRGPRSDDVNLLRKTSVALGQLRRSRKSEHAGYVVLSRTPLVLGYSRVANAPAFRSERNMHIWMFVDDSRLTMPIDGFVVLSSEFLATLKSRAPAPDPTPYILHEEEFAVSIPAGEVLTSAPWLTP